MGRAYALAGSIVVAGACRRPFNWPHWASLAAAGCGAVPRACPRTVSEKGTVPFCSEDAQLDVPRWSDRHWPRKDENSRLAWQRIVRPMGPIALALSVTQISTLGRQLAGLAAHPAGRRTGHRSPGCRATWPIRCMPGRRRPSTMPSGFISCRSACWAWRRRRSSFRNSAGTPLAETGGPGRRPVGRSAVGRLPVVAGRRWPDAAGRAAGAVGLGTRSVQRRGRRPHRRHDAGLCRGRRGLLRACRCCCAGFTPWAMHAGRCRPPDLALAINTALDLALAWPLGESGLALATAVSSLVQLLLLGAASARHAAARLARSSPAARSKPPWPRRSGHGRGARLPRRAGGSSGERSRPDSLWRRLPADVAFFAVLWALDSDELAMLWPRASRRKAIPSAAVAERAQSPVEPTAASDAPLAGSRRRASGEQLGAVTLLAGGDDPIADFVGLRGWSACRRATAGQSGTAIACGRPPLAWDCDNPREFQRFQMVAGRLANRLLDVGPGDRVGHFQVQIARDGRKDRQRGFAAAPDRPRRSGPPAAIRPRWCRRAARTA